MENIFTGLAILLGVSSTAMLILFFIFRNKVNNQVEATITYDHIEEELPKRKRVKSYKPNQVKRKYKKKNYDT